MRAKIIICFSVLFCGLGSQGQAVSLKECVRYGGVGMVAIAAAVALYQTKCIANLKKEIFVQEIKKRNAKGVERWVAHYALLDAQKALAEAKISRAIALGFSGAGVGAIGGSFLMKDEVKDGNSSPVGNQLAASEEQQKWFGLLHKFFSGSSEESSLPKPEIVVLGQDTSAELSTVNEYICKRPEDAAHKIAFQPSVLRPIDAGGGGNCGPFVMIKHLKRFGCGSGWDVASVRKKLALTLWKKISDELDANRTLKEESAKFNVVVPEQLNMTYVFQLLSVQFAKEVATYKTKNPDASFIQGLYYFLKLYAEKIGFCEFNSSIVGRKWKTLEPPIVCEENWIDSFELGLFAQIVNRPVIEFRENGQGEYQMAGIHWPEKYDRSQFNISKAALFYNKGNYHWQVLRLDHPSEPNIASGRHGHGESKEDAE